MSTTNIIEISGKSDDALYPSSQLDDINSKYNTSDPVVAILSATARRQLQEKKDKLKQIKAASAFTTIFTCMLCVAMSVVIITKLLEDRDRLKLYNILSENSSSPKVYENQQRPNSLAPVLLKYNDLKFEAQIALTTTESVAGLNNSVTEIPVNNETNTLQTNELNFNATTQNTMNVIPTVEPLMTTSSSDNLNMNKLYILSYFLIVLLIFKF